VCQKERRNAKCLFKQFTSAVTASMKHERSTADHMARKQILRTFVNLWHLKLLDQRANTFNSQLKNRLMFLCYFALRANISKQKKAELKKLRRFAKHKVLKILLSW
jgi:hypothetical protein